MKSRRLIEAIGQIDDDLISGAVEYRRKPFAVRRPRRTALKIAAAVIAVLLLGTVTAYALGHDLWGAIGRWSAETFHFEIHSDTTETRLDPEVKAGLAEFQIPESLVPKSQLAGFEARPPEFQSTDVSCAAIFAFQNEDGRLYYIKITRYDSETSLEKQIFEKDDTPVEEYTSGGKTFYILSNLDTLTATWSDGVFLERIAGDLTRGEVKAIIDSIGVYKPVSVLDPEVKAGLAERGIPESLVPTLCPEGFELIQQEFFGNGLSDTFLLAYQDENERFYSVTVERDVSEAYVEKMTFEKDDEPVEEYVSGGRTFYIFSNGNGAWTTAAWSDGVFLVDIVGSLTRDEIKAIIDSIGA